MLVENVWLLFTVTQPPTGPGTAGAVGAPASRPFSGAGFGAPESPGLSGSRPSSPGMLLSNFPAPLSSDLRPSRAPSQIPPSTPAMSAAHCAMNFQMPSSVSRVDSSSEFQPSAMTPGITRENRSVNMNLTLPTNFVIHPENWSSNEAPLAMASFSPESAHHTQSTVPLSSMNPMRNVSKMVRPSSNLPSTSPSTLLPPLSITKKSSTIRAIAANLRNPLMNGRTRAPILASVGPNRANSPLSPPNDDRPAAPAATKPPVKIRLLVNASRNPRMIGVSSRTAPRSAGRNIRISSEPRPRKCP